MEHVPHSPQLETMQSTLQACWLQNRCCVSGGQLPLRLLGKVATRVRVALPTPQRREHDDQVLQTETVQGIGASYAM